MTTPLQHQIDEFNAEASRYLPADLLQDLMRPVAQLRASSAAQRALPEGAQAPNFTLPDTRGHAVTLSHLLAQGRSSSPSSGAPGARTAG